MREIIFRGKRKDNGAWVIGNLIAGSSGFYGKQKAYIIPKLSCIEQVVDPTSIGQYIGLEDIKGKQIFEGDIIEDRTKYKTKDIEDIYRRYEVRYSTELARFLARLSNGVFNPAAFQNCEVIGNIIDNPGLLEGETE